MKPGGLTASGAETAGAAPGSARRPVRPAATARRLDSHIADFSALDAAAARRRRLNAELKAQPGCVQDVSDDLGRARNYRPPSPAQPAAASGQGSLIAMAVICQSIISSAPPLVRTHPAVCLVQPAYVRHDSAAGAALSVSGPCPVTEAVVPSLTRQIFMASFLISSPGSPFLYACERPLLSGSRDAALVISDSHHNGRTLFVCPTSC